MSSLSECFGVSVALACGGGAGHHWCSKPDSDDLLCSACRLLALLLRDGLRYTCTMHSIGFSSRSAIFVPLLYGHWVGHSDQAASGRVGSSSRGSSCSKDVTHSRALAGASLPSAYCNPLGTWGLRSRTSFPRLRYRFGYTIRGRGQGRYIRGDRKVWPRRGFMIKGWRDDGWA